MKSQTLVKTLSVVPVLVSAIVAAAPIEVKTELEYFYGSETRKEYERSFYVKDGKEVLHGIETFWFFDGAVEGKVSYKDGKLDGKSVWYYQNGDMRWECVHRSDRLISGKYYHHNSRLSCEIIDGNGQWKEYDEATGSKIVYIANYLSGVKNGEEVNYSDNGEVYSFRVWEHGVMKSEERP